MTIKAALILIAVLFCFGSGYYLRGLECEEAEDRAALKQEAENRNREKSQATITTQEATTYAAAVNEAIHEPDPAPAVLCVRKYVIASGSVPKTGTTGAGDHGAGGLPPGAPQPLPGPTDIGGAAVAIGARANAQVAALKDYIARVCLAP